MRFYIFITLNKLIIFYDCKFWKLRFIIYNSSTFIYNVNKGKEKFSDKEGANTMEPISPKLIQEVQKGDQSAFQTLYDLCYQHVYSYALNLSHNEADAKDITQETFLQVYQSIHKLQSPEAFPLWLNRIVYSKFHRILAKQKETATEQDTLQYHVDNSEQAKKVNDAYLLDDKEIIRNMIDKLTEKQKEVIRLMYYEQYTSNEIAVLLQLPEGTVKSRIFEAKKALQKQIKEFEKTENRKLVLHTDTLLPMGVLAFLTKIKDYFKYSSSSQKLLIASMTSMVIVSTTAVANTLPYIQQSHQEEEQEPMREIFRPVNYHEEPIENAKEAYFTLMKWAPDKAHVEKKTKEEKAELNAVIAELKRVQSPYYQLLIKDGWLDAFEK